MKKLNVFQILFCVGILFPLSVFSQLTNDKALTNKATVIYSDVFSTGGWETWYSNETTNNLMKPDFSVNESVAYQPKGKSVVITGNENEQARGSYHKDLKAAGISFVKDQYYRFTAWYAVENITGVNERVFACVTWGSVWNTKKLIPVALEKKDTYTWIRAERIIKIEKKTSKVELQLTASWLPDSSAVYYGKVMIESLPNYNPSSRKINVVTIGSAPPIESTLQENGNHYVKQIREACKKAITPVDVVCLPEYFNSYNVSRKTLFDIAVDMDTSTYMQGFKNIAKEYNVNIVGSVVVLENDIPYNTAFLIDRDGNVVDTQRKLHMPMQEYWQGGGRGDELKVIQADFGKIGLLVCWDYFLTDPIRSLALKGAEIIFVPIEGDNRSANGQERKATEYIGVASSIQNNIPMVFSFSPKNIRRGNDSLIIDRDGIVKGRSSIDNSTIYGEIDLNRNNEDWFINFFMDRRPELYQNNNSQLALWSNGAIKYVPNPNLYSQENSSLQILATP